MTVQNNSIVTVSFAGRIEAVDTNGYVSVREFDTGALYSILAAHVTESEQTLTVIDD